MLLGLRCTARAVGALGRSPPGISGAPSDGARPLQPAVRGARAWREREACHLRCPPEGTSDVAPPQARFIGSAYIERRTIRRHGGLAGQTIAIEGLSRTSTDVLARIEGLGGATTPIWPSVTRAIRSLKPSRWAVEAPPPLGPRSAVDRLDLPPHATRGRVRGGAVGLPSATLLVGEHLVRAGLADVDDRTAGEMPLAG